MLRISYLTISSKGYSGLLVFCLDLELFRNIRKDLDSTK